MNFVVSYPKSGNTWNRLVAAAYGTEAKREDLAQFRTEKSDLPELEFADIGPSHYQAVSPVPISDIDFPTQARLRPAAMLMLSKEVSHFADRRPLLIQSHHFYRKVTGIPLWHSKWVDRVVNPVRDPREVCCSHAAHFGNSYEESARYMSNPDASTGANTETSLNWMLGSWSDHVRSWLSVKDFPVFTVRYRDMKADPVGQFYDIFEFLDIPGLSVDAVEDAVARTQFDRLKETAAEQGAPVTGHQGEFFRSGKTDGWKDELPVEVARKIEKDHGEMMEALGYL
ncbi:sulfotransferase domain-containing protein [Salinibacter ruber]|uniref:sulfotransferase domain-containing protein n=1 Tax=Salinibacter ruber TaxID=146919 RepID=UPI0021671711|nr:sulfotransferase domain-containing protein [Salinibacter ruber]MCS3696433.1 hypothetical protein [Salinibacter ruber]